MQLLLALIVTTLAHLLLQDLQVRWLLALIVTTLIPISQSSATISKCHFGKLVAKQKEEKCQE